MESTETKTVTTHLDRSDALRLIGLAGGERDHKGRYVINGRTYWHIDEALRYALIEVSAANGVEL